MALKRPESKKRSLTRQEVKRTLRYSVLDGTFNAAKIGFGESFFPAFAILMKATNFQIGLLQSLPQALGSILQLFSNKLIKFFRSRQRFVVYGAILECLMYIPIALVFFFGTLRVFHLILFTSLYWIFGMILSPAWNSWMGDLVDEDKKGSYFGRRNKITGLTSFFAFVLGGYILQQFSGSISVMYQYLGFATIFALAFSSRIFSIIYLTKKSEPEYHIQLKAQFTFFEFMRQARFRNYGMFVIYLCLMNFAVYLAGPYFTAYMLYDLKFDYITFTLVSATALIVKYLTMPIWGKAADRYGSKKVLQVSGTLMPITPLLWVFSDQVWFLILVQVYSGFVWAGFEISSFNFIFDTTTSPKRATCVAYYNVLNGIGIFAGAMIGELIIRFNNLFWSKYLLVFITSFALRYLISAFLLPKLKEARQVENISENKLLMDVITTMPTMGLIHRMITTHNHKRKA